ncbi:MAG: hypothetical protein IJ200_06240 [Prevotella sp.]|nr:hypothetical protein [Prevotella sp.]
MKKIFTLTVLFAFCLVTFAQEGDKAYTLTKNRVIYLTCDTMTVDPAYPDEPLSWSSNFLANQFNAAGMALTGGESTDWNYQIAFRNDYTDPETGFTLNKGYYRGITLMDNKLGLYGTYLDENGVEYDYSSGYKNLKKVVLYFVPLPNAKCASHGYNYNHDRLPSNGGRIEAQYMNPDGTAKSNNAYRDPSVGTTLVHGGTPCEPSTEHPDGLSYDEYYYTLTDCALNYEAVSDDAFITGYNAALVTIDQPFKMAVNLENKSRSTAYDTEVESESKKTEFSKKPIDGLTELEMNYYFADINDCWPYYERDPNPEEVGTATSATGYNAAPSAGKWGKKVAWSSDTPIKIGIKYRLYLIGIALVCATDGAETEFVNTGDFTQECAFTTEKTAAFGNPVEGNMPEDAWEGRRWGNKVDAAVRTITVQTAADAPVYNLQGQRVSTDTKGLLVREGKKFVNK